MYSQVLRQHMATMPLSGAFKEQLSLEGEQQGCLFYLELPQLLAPLFPGVSPDQLMQLAVNNYLYFRAVTIIEQLFEQPGGPTAAQLRDLLTLQEHAVRGLANLFAPQDDFWQYYKRCQQRYATANILLKARPSADHKLDEEDFEELAAGKSAIYFAIVHALASLNQQGCSMQPLLDCLTSINLAGEYTESEYPQDAQHGREHYERSLELAHQLGLPQLSSYLQEQMRVCQMRRQVA